MDKYLSYTDFDYQIIQDIWSVINYNKKGLRQLLKTINNKRTNKIVVFYRDRLLGFGFELVEYIANLNGCEIEVLDNTEKQRNKNWLKMLFK